MAEQGEKTLLMPESLKHDTQDITDIDRRLSPQPSQTSRTPARLEGSSSSDATTSLVPFQSCSTVDTPHQARKDAVKLCDNCRMIDFQKVLEIDAESLQNPANEGGIYIAKLDKPENGCELCSLWWSVFPDYLGQRPSQLLYARSSIDHDRGFLNGVDRPILEAIPEAFLDPGIVYDGTDVGCFFAIETSEEMDTPGQVPPYFEPSTAKLWINQCKLHHTSSCTYNGQPVQGLKLINCETYSITAVSQSVSYVALSYVWGAEELDMSLKLAECNRLPQNIPEIISDAIAAAKALSYKWIWIDKYCIDQSNTGKMRHQINQMDAIYAGADLTIIAALGDRLPGIGGKIRKRQPVVRVGKTTVASALSHPHEVIRSSRWSTRGWTYQEAVLSLRRLIFTDEQLYFECRAGHLYESPLYYYPGMISHEDWEADLKLPQRPGLFSGRRNPTNLQSPVTKLFEFQWHIEEYSKRELSYENDSLRAFLGIARYYERSPEIHGFSVHHLWGVPFSTTISPEHNANYKSLLSGLLWTYDGKLAKPKRRMDFPSWSWTSWSGPHHFGVLLGAHFLTLSSHIIELYLECRPGCLTEFSHIVRTNSTLELPHPRALHMDLLVCHPPTSWTAGNHPGRVHFNGLVADYRPLQDPSNCKTIQDALHEGTCQLLLLGSGEVSDLPHYRFFLVYLMVVEVKGDFASRIGLMTVDGSFEEFEKHVRLEQRRVCLI